MKDAKLGQGQQCPVCKTWNHSGLTLPLECVECIKPLMAKTEPVAEVPCSAGVIKPCPFCGNEALWYENENLSKGWGNYACTVCGAKRFPNASNKREGLIIWNARAL